MSDQIEQEKIELKVGSDENIANQETDAVLRSADDIEGDPQLPCIADDLETICLIGSGGMSDVFKVQNKETGAFFAAKILKGNLLGDERAKQRFLQECSIIQKLDHPNIIKVIDSAVTKDGTPYLLLEWIEGKTLAEEIAESPLNAKLARNIFFQMCQGLEYAHESGIIHRDIKPSNVLLIKKADGYDVKIMDFGIAKILGTETSNKQSFETETGAVIGSPAYMSPEQCMGETVDARSDIYSMGCLMYETLTGKNPFIASTPMGTILNHLEKDPEDLLTAEEFVKRKIPSELENCIINSLAKNPSLRYTNAYKLKEALFAPAGAFARILASAIDIALVVLLNLGTVLICKQNPAAADWIALHSNYYLLSGFLIYTLYFSLLEYLFGATPGKLITRLRVRSIDGKRPSFIDSFSRASTGYALFSLICGFPNMGEYARAIDRVYSSSYELALVALGWLTMFTFFYLAGCFFFVFGQKRQWHFDTFFNRKIVTTPATAACSVKTSKSKAVALAMCCVSTIVALAVPFISQYLPEKAWGDPGIPKIMNVVATQKLPKGAPINEEDLTLEPELFAPSYCGPYHDTKELKGKIPIHDIYPGVTIFPFNFSEGDTIKSYEHYISSAYAAESESDFVDAEDYFKKAVEKDPKCKLAWEGLVRVYEKTGEKKKAIEAKAKAAACPEASAERLASLLNSSDSEYKSMPAVYLCTHALKKYPGDQATMYELSRAYGILNAPISQESILESLLRKNPGNASVLSDLAKLRLKMAESYSIGINKDAELQEAVKYALEAQKLDPNNFNSRFTLAQAYQAQDKFDEASAAYRKCMNIAPESKQFTQAREKLEELLRDNGKEAEADELAKQAPVDNNDSDTAEARKPEN